MAYKSMEVAPINEERTDQFAWEKTMTLAAAANGDWLLIPDEVVGISVTVSAVGTTVKVQTSTDTVGVVKVGTSVTATDWDLGTVAAGQDYCRPITAIRMVQAGAGSSKMMVRAQ